MSAEYEIIKKLENVCSNILNTSRNQLYVSMRYLAMAFDGLSYALSNETDTLGTDGFHLFYSPAFLMEKYSKGGIWINRAYVHIIFHCIFKHPISMDTREERLWNVSCDIVCEFIIDGMDISSLKQNKSATRRLVYDEISKTIKVPTAQRVYRLISENEKILKQLKLIEEEFYIDDHSFWLQYQSVKQPSSSENSEGDSEGEENPDNADNENPDKPEKSKDDFNEKWENISQKTETDMETFSRDKSDEAGGMTEFLRIENRQRYDYRSFLEKFTVQREDMQLDLDSYDYIYYTYGLKVYGNMPLIENLEYKDVKRIEEFVIVIDTSASCESDLVKRFLEETYSIISENESFFRKIQLHIIQCDSKVQSNEVIAAKEDFQQYMQRFEVKGRGGTDFRAAFEYVNDLVEEKKLNNLKGLIYFTDGYGTYPKNMPQYETAFVFLDDNFDDKGVPPWATEIILDKENIYSFGGNER